MRWPIFLLFLEIVFAVVSATAGGAPPVDNVKILLGSWSGRVTGPQGGPPTGDVVVTFEKSGNLIAGKIIVKAPGGAQYSGQISDITLKNKIFSATAIFKLGENPLETRVSGPIKGKTIAGEFSVMAKGQKMGDGTFTITKETAAKSMK
jgi:hypothetical protein